MHSVRAASVLSSRRHGRSCQTGAAATWFSRRVPGARDWPGRAGPIQSHTQGRRIEEREEAQMYQTKNDLPAQTRADVIGIRNARLADSIDLIRQAKQAHWHVKRPSCIALHTLF